MRRAIFHHCSITWLKDLTVVICFYFERPSGSVVLNLRMTFETLIFLKLLPSYLKLSQTNRGNNSKKMLILPYLSMEFDELYVSTWCRKKLLAINRTHSARTNRYDDVKSSKISAQEDLKTRMIASFQSISIF